MPGQKRRIAILPRLVAALVVGTIIFVVCRNTAYKGFRDSHVVQIKSTYTLRGMASVRDAIEDYREENGVLPTSLRDVSPRENAYYRTDESGIPVDEWERPLRYSTDDADYRLVSYGRDGKPGGEGLDADLSTSDLLGQEEGTRGWHPLPERAKPTFEQFVEDRGEFGMGGSGRRMFVTSIVTGGLAFLVAFLTLWRSRNLERMIIGLIVTTLGAVFIGALIVGMHAPTGH
jgi:general secretion pathway protein G